LTVMAVHMRQRAEAVECHIVLRHSARQAHLVVVKVEVADVPLPMRSAWYASCTETRQRLED
jgi:hypothetical protein